MTEQELCKTVTIGVIAYNEQRYLQKLLDSIVEQSYSHKLIDIILVDSNSTDSTKSIMEKFKKENEKEFLSIGVYDNLKRIQPAGWNVVLQHFNADVLVRVDAHAELNNDFVEKIMACLNSGEYVCGGTIVTVSDNKSMWMNTLKKAEKSVFGASIAKYKRLEKTRRYVDTAQFAAYRREVTKKVGLFNEKLLRTEDNEYHYRVRKAGYQICFDPSIKSRYLMRGSFAELLKQKYQNGEWIGRTLFSCPQCISWYHMIPAIFVAGVIVSLVMVKIGIVFPAKLLWILYILANLIMSITAGINSPTDLLLPFVFLALHVSYGAGTIIGIIKEAIARIK